MQLVSNPAQSNGRFGAMMKEASSTTMKDVLPVLITSGKIIGVIFVLGTGNILLAGLGYWFYRQWSNKTHATTTTTTTATTTTTTTPIK
jgi:hypothetical protein